MGVQGASSIGRRPGDLECCKCGYVDLARSGSKGDIDGRVCTISLITYLVKVNTSIDSVEYMWCSITGMSCMRGVE